MKSARVNFTGRPNSLSTSAKPEIEVIGYRRFADLLLWARCYRPQRSPIKHQ
jgi:hypothetical protein